MNIEINLLELVSELAELKLVERYEMNNLGYTDEEVHALIFNESKEITTYKEEAQEIFNDYYYEFYDVIEKLAIKKHGK